MNDGFPERHKNARNAEFCTPMFVVQDSVIRQSQIEVRATDCQVGRCRLRQAIVCMMYSSPVSVCGILPRPRQAYQICRATDQTISLCHRLYMPGLCLDRLVCPSEASLTSRHRCNMSTEPEALRSRRTRARSRPVPPTQVPRRRPSRARQQSAPRRETTRARRPQA